MKVQFWGTRGSHPISDKKYMQFGGNTSCVSVHTPRYVFIFDAGTGIIQLGRQLANESKKELVLCLTHCHLDHIMGLAFLDLTYDPKAELRIVAGTNPIYEGIQRILANIFSPPYFPIPWVERKGHIIYDDNFSLAPRTYDDERISLLSINLDHPGGACGYRLTYNKRSVCYITDTGHNPSNPNQHLLEFINGADLLIYDTTFTEAEFKAQPDWGHSTAEEAVRLASQAKVKQLALFHHSPDKDDTKVRQIERAARKKFANCFCAYDGMKLEV